MYELHETSQLLSERKLWIGTFDGSQGRVLLASVIVAVAFLVIVVVAAVRVVEELVGPTSAACTDVALVECGVVVLAYIWACAPMAAAAATTERSCRKPGMSNRKRS